jgi:hypothetical protein
MNAILSQDKKHIVSTEALDHIEAEGATIYAYTVGGAKLILGNYKNEVCAKRVMCFIGFGITAEHQKTVVLPPEELIDDAKPKEGFARMEISPEFAKLLAKLMGGDEA